MPLLLADFIYTRDCKLNLRKNVDTTYIKVRAWQVVSSFLPASGQRKSRKPFHDFLLGGAAGGRLVFSFYGRDRLANGKLSF